MNIAESKTITRGTLWLVITFCVVLILGLCSASASAVIAWAHTIDERGLENQRRITVLETKFAAMDQKLDSAAERQRDMLELLRSHMGIPSPK